MANMAFLRHKRFQQRRTSSITSVRRHASTPESVPIVELGEVHCEDRPKSDYDLSLCRLGDATSVGIDASKKGNQARFVNDYRGIADKPNVAFSERRNEHGELRMSLYSGNQDIKKGSELLVSYGKSWWQHRTGSANAAP